MSIETLTQEAKKHFPDLEIRYKDQSIFMKVLGTLMFFNKDFMTKYITTIGSKVYFPSEEHVATRPLSSSITLLHELVHIYDSKKFTSLLFSFLYLVPQILILVALPLMFISWKVALVLMVLFALPLPAYFRMYFERRAYISTLYVYKTIADRTSKVFDYNKHKESAIAQFKTSAYYYMWMFKGIKNDFDKAIVDVKEGKKPYDDKILDIVADLSRFI